MKLLVIWLLIENSFSVSTNRAPFPDYFKFGAASSAYQIEGAWNTDGKGEHIWDRFSHTRLTENGDVACDSYHEWKRDIEMLKEMGSDHYRFSLTWTRILPTGYTNRINKAGVTYYKNIIKELKRNGIEPMITLYHWELPQDLQDLGGWTNDIVIESFANFSRICFELFGEDVKYWITINEPFQLCDGGYGGGFLAPGVYSPGIGEYLCGHNVLKAHARVWHMYNDEFRHKQKGLISITAHCNWYEPASNDTEDLEAAETLMQFYSGWFLHPIFIGDYPQIMRERIANRSKLEGFPRSRLPEFTEDEIVYINGTHDFLGLNYYSARAAKHSPEPPVGDPSWEKDTGVTSFLPSNWENTGSSSMKNTPWAFKKILKWLKDEYNSPEILVTENGVATDELLNDTKRIKYIKEHLSFLHEAMVTDKVNVTLYTIWSLMDSFEWLSGYEPKFGLYHTDFHSPKKTRTPRKSVEYYKSIIKTHKLDWGEENEGK